AREDQLLAEIDQGKLPAIGQHGFDGLGIERPKCRLRWHPRLAPSCPALCRASTPYFLMKQDVDGRDKPGHDVASLLSVAKNRWRRLTSPAAASSGGPHRTSGR